MKGLYVYGALSMALCFVVGVEYHHAHLMAAAVIAAAVAALGEAVHEVVRIAENEGDDSPYRNVGNIIAVLSWIATGVMVISALLTLWGIV